MSTSVYVSQRESTWTADVNDKVNDDSQLEESTWAVNV